MPRGSVPRAAGSCFSTFRARAWSTSVPWSTRSRKSASPATSPTSPARARGAANRPGGADVNGADELERLRGRIDQVNDRILEALNERARLAREIGTLKVGQAYRPEREAQVLRRIKEANRGPLPDETVAL